ncbi:MAG TPA: glycosyltransferase N-terminal domain-containing protein [Saprospiraceae bacterium]|nr:glycosyltransferase N-terminal domain-containing protein [Saprospiraceae bacterium]HMQ85100.1 glycosyltransferase N-terminal domain-containing protein [Saprospiraceae bacterium]
MLLLYKLLIRLYGLGLYLASFFHPKARKWHQGRKNWRAKHRALKQDKIQTGQPLIWMHCASLGEFEQGRPILEGLKRNQAKVQILLSFYSPSGFEIRKDYPMADAVVYLPLDTHRNAQQFLHIWQPNVAIFVKYEIWYHFLHQLEKRTIPTVLIAALFRPEQFFFQWYGRPVLKRLRHLTHIFVQEAASAQLLHRFGFEKVSIAGDTRIDRVLAIAAQKESLPKLEAFTQTKAPVFLVGSNWPQDDTILFPFFRQGLPDNWKIILAPHHVDEHRMGQLEKQILDSRVRYSEENLEAFERARVLIIDNIGLLSRLYRYGKIAYIGGGFGSGIHNTLEPMAFGLPIIFGPKHQKFREAVYLVASGSGFCVENMAELKQAFETLQNEEHYQAVSGSIRTYLEQNEGASEQILSYIKQL